MSDMLSQDEIDALLGGGGGESPQPEGDELDLEAVGEVLRVVTEAGMESLSDVLQAEVDVAPEGAALTAFDTFVNDAGASTAIVAELGGSVDGVLVYALPPEGAAKLGALMLGEAVESDPSEEVVDGFREAMEEAKVQLAHALEAVVGSGVNLSLSDPIELSPESIDTAPVPIGADESVVHASFRFSLAGVGYPLHALLPIDVAESITATLGAQEEPSSQEGGAAATNAPESGEVEAMTMSQARTTESAPIAAEPAASPASPGSKVVQVGEVSFKSLKNDVGRSEASNIDLLLDVPLQVTVELGRTRMQIRDILELGKGSVVELEKLAGEPVEIFVNGKLIAKGEVVTIDENFGVKITDIVSRQERVSNLG